MAEGTVDNLNIQLSADADQAVKSLNNLASTLRSINTAFTKDISGMRKFSKEIGTLNSALKGLNNIKTPDLSKLSKAMKSLSETKTSGAKSTADDVKDIVNSLKGLGNVNFNESGITKLTNSLKRLAQVDMSAFDVSKFKQITDSVSTLGNMPDVSSSVNRFVSSLSRLANAGTKTGQSANDILRLGQQTALAARELGSVGAINDDVNMFVQSIGRLATAGNKTAQTASGLSTLSKETIEFFKAMQNAPKVSQNTIAMTQALAQLASAGGKVGTATNSVTGAFEKLSRAGTSTMNALKKASSGIVSALQRITGAGKGVNSLSLSLGNLLKTAVGFNIGYGLLNFGKSMFTLGSDVTEVENVVDVAFGGMAQSAYDFAKTAQEQFGLSELSALRYSGILMSMFNASGVAQRDAAEMSTTLTGLAGDLASFYNIDQEDAFTKLRSALAGEVEPMRALGVDMTVASMEAYALSQGITESWQSMSQAEKVMLRYNYLMSVTSAQQNDFQRTQASFANQTRLLTLNLQQLAATLGQGLIAAVLPAVTALNKLFAVLQKAAIAVRNFFYVLTGYKGGGSSGIVNDLASIGDASTGLEDLGSSGSDAADGLGDAAKAAEELKNATLGIDELNIISPNEPTSTGGTGGSGGGGGAGGVGGTDLGLDDGLLDLGGKEPEEYVSPWAEAIRKAFLAEDWEELGAVIADGLNRGLQKVYDVISWENVGPKITAFTTAFTETFNSFANAFDFDLLGRTIGTGINTIVNTLNNLIDGINWKNLGGKLATGLNGMVYEINWYEFGRLLGNRFMIAWDTFLGFATNLDFGAIGTAIADGINGFFAEFNFADIVNGINEFVDGIWELLFNAVSKIKWGKIFDQITDAVGNLELDTAFLIAIPAINKVQKAIKNLKKTGLIDWAKDLSRNFKGFAAEVKTSGSLMGTLKGRISNVTSQMSKLQKGVVGATSVFLEFSMIKDAFYDISLGVENVIGSIAKIGVSAGVASAALYTAFGPAGIAIGAITGLVAAVSGLNKAFEEQEQIEIFGDKLSNLTTKINETSNALKNRVEESKSFVESAGIAEASVAQDLSDRYFNLAEKESLTNAEKEEMRRISQLLIDQFPELEQYYNSQTGLLDTTKESIDKLIESRLKEIQLQAVEEQLTQAYKDQYDALQNLESALEPANAAQKKMNDLEKEYQEISDKQKLLEEYNRLSEKINTAEGDTGGLIEKQKELWNELTNNGEDTNYLFPDYISQKLSEVSTQMDLFEEDYNEALGTLSEANEAYEAVGSNIETLTQMLTSGMVDAANDSADGYANTLSENESMANTAKQKADSILASFREGLDAHSPSVRFQEAGHDSIDGYVIGIEERAKTAQDATKNVANSLTKIFEDTLLSGTKKVADSIPAYFQSAYNKIILTWSPLNSWFYNKWVSIKNVFSEAPSSFRNWFQSAYSSVTTVWSPANVWFRAKWTSIKSVFSDVQSFFREGFQKAYDSVTNIWDGLGDFFKKIAKNAFAPIKTLVNGIIKGINWVLKEVDSGTRVSEWSGVAFAKGSDGVPKNTLGVVNDQKGATYKELIVPPNGKPFIPKGRNVMLPLQKGTKIMPANQTKEFMKSMGVPHFAGGIGNLMGWNTDFSGDVMDYLQDSDKITKIAFDKFADISSMVGMWRDMASGMVGVLFDETSNFISKVFEKIVPKVDYNPSAGVEQWRSLAKYALQLEGQYTEANLDRLLMQMQTESGGNPNAINNWDINAKNGTPSKGLMQVIDPTFRAYAYPGYDKNIYDPLSNILAAIRYTLSRYGSLANGWKGHGYASGIGTINLSDLLGAIPKLAGGGVVMPGQLFVANERGPELLGRYGNRTTVMNNDQVVTSVSSGVEKAVERQNAEMTLLLRQILETNQRILAKDNSINLDGKRTNRLLDRAKSNAGYGFRRTVNAT